jgi:hypothetical protein
MARLALLSLAAAACAGLAPPAAAQAKVTLAPHRAIYDLTLTRSQESRGIDAARGRIVFEISGSHCEGFASNFRQVVEMNSSEAGGRVMDVRSTSFEESGGKGFRFKIDRVVNQQPQPSTEGRTQPQGGALAVELSLPKPERIELPGDVVFPSFHTKALIEAALAGQNTMSARTYDGSDEGKVVYDSFAVIGAAIARKPGETLEEAARTPALDGVRSWPVTISYYKAGSGDQTPAYVMSMELYENGVSRNLRLDYGTLALKGEMTRLEMGKPAAACG